MDVQMPEMDGIEATDCFVSKRRRSLDTSGMIAMTALAMKGDRERCIAAGMDGYLSKPIEADDLYRAIVDLVPSTKAGSVSRWKASPEPDAPSFHVPAGLLLDWNAMLQRFGGSREKVEKIVKVFQGELPRSMAEIRAALDRGDATSIEQTAHSLRGAIGLFGQGRGLHGRRRRWRRWCAGDLTDIGDAYESLEKSVHELELAVAEFVVLERSMTQPFA